MSQSNKIQQTLDYFQKFQNINLPFAFEIVTQNFKIRDKNFENLKNNSQNNQKIKSSLSKIKNENAQNWSQIDNPHVVFVGALHGNEPAGLDAIISFHKHFAKNNYKLQKGKITFILGSPESFKIGERFIDQNLNRAFTKVISNNQEGLRVAQIRQFLATSSVNVLLDFHSVSSGDFKMAIFQNRKAQKFAQKISPLNLYFWPRSEHLPGSLMEECQNFGTTALSFECGNHNSPNAPQIALIHLQNTLLEIGMVNKNQLIPVSFENGTDNSKIDLIYLPYKTFQNAQTEEKISKNQNQNSQEKIASKSENDQILNLQKFNLNLSQVTQTKIRNNLQNQNITKKSQEILINHQVQKNQKISQKLQNKTLEINQKTKNSITFYETLSIIRPQSGFTFVDKSATTGTAIKKDEIFAIFTGGNYKAEQDCFLVMPDHFPKTTDFDAGFLCQKSSL